MSIENRKSDRPPSDGPAGPVFSLLNRILDFLIKKFKSLPKPLQAVAYFVFLAFFCATAWRLVAGQYVVRGVVWDGDDYAEGCEVRIRGDYFSTNSKGMYYAVVSPLQYYYFAAKGEIDLPVKCKKRLCKCKDENGRCEEAKNPAKPVKRTFKVTLNYLDDEFSEIYLDAPSEVQRANEPSGVLSFSLIESAYAQERPTPPQRLPGEVQPAVPPATMYLPSSGDRLVVERITLGESAKKMREVEFEIEFGVKDKPLLLQGSEAGKLPLKPTVTFGDEYYFDVPQNRRGTAVSIEMETPGLFGKEEEFEFQMPTQYNTPVPVKGSKGSVLVLRLVPRTPPSSF